MSTFFNLDQHLCFIDVTSCHEPSITVTGQSHMSQTQLSLSCPISFFRNKYLVLSHVNVQLSLLSISQDSCFPNQRFSVFISKNEIVLFTCRGFRLMLHTDFFSTNDVFATNLPLKVKRMILFLNMKNDNF